MNKFFKQVIFFLLCSIVVYLSTSVILLLLAWETDWIQPKSIALIHFFTVYYGVQFLLAAGIILLFFNRIGKLVGSFSIVVSILWFIYISWSIATK